MKRDGEEGHDVDNRHVGANGKTAKCRLPGICNDVCVVLLFVGEFLSISCFDQNIFVILFLAVFLFDAELTTYAYGIHEKKSKIGQNLLPMKKIENGTEPSSPNMPKFPIFS